MYVSATAVGMRASNGVVLAAEKRFSYGGFIMSKSAKKVFRVADRIGIACAGLYADLQAIARMLEAEIRYYEISTGNSIKVSSAAKILGNILYSYKLLPLLSETLIGGRDSNGYHLYILDPLGSVIEDKYAAVGSGAQVAVGLIEEEYSDDMTIDRAEALAVKALKVTMERDALSGDGIDILIIDDKGVREKSLAMKKTLG